MEQFPEIKELGDAAFNFVFEGSDLLKRMTKDLDPEKCERVLICILRFGNPFFFLVCCFFSASFVPRMLLEGGGARRGGGDDVSRLFSDANAHSSLLGQETAQVVPETHQ